MALERKRRESPYPWAKKEALRLYLEEDLGASAILEELAGIAEGRAMPTDRTVREWRREFAVREGEPWSLAAADGPSDLVEHDAHLVLPILESVFTTTKGRIAYLTNSEARWVARIRRAVPDPRLDGWTTYVVARRYMAATRDKDTATLADLDRYLALAPWRSPTDLARYQQAVQQRRTEHVVPIAYAGSAAGTGQAFNATIEVKENRP